MNTEDKKLYASIKKRAKAADIESYLVRPIILRVYAELSATSHSAKFDLRDVTAVLPKVEKTLGKNDTFFSNGKIAIGLQKIIGGNVGNIPIIFYGDKLVFAAAGAAGTLPEHSAIELLYNSSLSLKTNSKLRLEDYDTSVFCQVPYQQETAALKSSGGIHYVDLGANFVIQGGVDNSAEIVFDGIGDRTNINGGIGKNYVVLLMQGVIVKGGATNKDFAAYAAAAQAGDL